MKNFMQQMRAGTRPGKAGQAQDSGKAGQAQDLPLQGKLSITCRGTPCGCPNAGKAGQAQGLEMPGGHKTLEKPGRHKTRPYGVNYRLRVGAPLVGARNQSQAGLTLIELIVAMIVISVALVGVMSVINYTTRHSADPVLRHQAIAIAEAYMEEIVLKEFDNPDGGHNGNDRRLFDDVSDYNNLTDTGAHNHEDELINGLGGYDVAVEVEDIADWHGVPAKKITVTVTSPANEDISLISYRTDY